jgi:hypothetical protein
MIKTKFGEFEIKKTNQLGHSECYTVTKFKGQWPNEDTLIDMCDRYNFGGIVKFSGDYAYVTVWTD